jgi:hypothetical protein
VCVFDGQRNGVGIEPDQQGGVIVGWSDGRRKELDCSGHLDGGDDWDQYAQRLSPNGFPKWALNGIPICNAPYNQFGVVSLPDGNGGMIRVWSDYRWQCSAIYRSDYYCERVDRKGRLLGPEPSLISVADTPGDQGHQLDVQWKPSALDQGAQPRITQYRIWRQVGSGVPAPALTLPASFACTYNATITTPADSVVGVSTPLVRVWVEARDSASGETWITPPRSGIALDNLKPPAPAPLHASLEWTGSRWAVLLDWRRSAAPDVSEYRVYRSSMQELGGSVTVVARYLNSTPDTTWADTTFIPGETIYYVLAADMHGNLSDAAEATTQALVGIAPDGPGGGIALGPATPSPSRGAVRLRLHLDSAAPVQFACFDPAGRLVARPLVGILAPGDHDLIWDGRNSSGVNCPNGVYYLRVQAEGRTFVRRCVRI